MSVPEVNSRPKLRKAYAVLGRSVSWAIESSGSAWPEATQISVLGNPGEALNAELRAFSEVQTARLLD